MKFKILVIFLLLFSLKTFSQDEELNVLKTEAIAKMKSLGFKFMEQVEGMTDSKNVLKLNQSKFIYGYSYIVVSLFKKCTNCHLAIEFWHPKSDAPQIMAVETIFNETSYNISESRINESNNSFFFIDYSDKRGDVYLYVNAGSSKYLTSMLFSK